MYCVVVICCIVVGCTQISNDVKSTDLNKIEHDIKEMSNDRLLITDLNENDESLLQAEIKYSMEEVLILQFYAEYNEDNVIDRMYVKSNMNNEDINIFNIEKTPVVIDSNINLEMYDYRTISIQLKDVILYYDIEYFINSDEYPDKHQIILDNRPQLPYINESCEIVIKRKNNYFKCNNKDTNILIEELRKITDENLIEIYDSSNVDNIPYVIYVLSENMMYKYEPVMNKGQIIIQGVRYNMKLDKIEDIVNKNIGG